MTKIRNILLLLFMGTSLFVGIMSPVLAEAQDCDPRHFNRQCQPFFSGWSNVNPAYAHPANRYPPNHPGFNGNWNGVSNGAWGSGTQPWGTQPWGMGSTTDTWGNIGYRNGEIGVSGGYRTFDPRTGTSHGGSIFSDTWGNTGGSWGFHKRN